MLTKYDKFVHNLQNMNERKDYSTYTQLIKNERIKRNETLEVMSKGICSVSYLSKLENNTIKPSEDYVRALLERVDINYDDVEITNYEEELELSLKMYFRENIEGLKKITERLKNNYFDARVSMIRCFYLLSINEFDEFKEIIKELDGIKNLLVGNQSIILIFLVCEYYRLVSRFADANNYISFLNTIKIDSYELKMLLAEVRLICSFHLRNTSDVCNFFLKTRNSEEIGYPINRKMRNMLLVKITLGDYNLNGETLELLDILQNTNYPNDDWQLLYLICMAYVKTNEFAKAMDIIKGRGVLIEANFLALFGYCIYALKAVKEIELFLEYFNNLENDSNSDVHYHFLEFLKIYFAEGDSYKLFEYLRFNAIPFSKSYQHIIYNKTYSEKYVEILVKLSRYKDATNHLLNYK